MNPYISILKLLLDYQLYSKYYKNLNLDFIEKNYPELYKLYAVLPELHKKEEQKVYTPLDLKIVFLASYPKADEAFYSRVFQDLVEDNADASHVQELLRSLAERHKGLEIAKLALKVSEGHASLTELKDEIEGVEVEVEEDDFEQYFVRGTIHELLQDVYQAPGFRWRLNSLNKRLGSLRKGDFGFVFARPEAGKTTFLASEMSFMAEQLKEDQGPILWLNNEEGGKKVKIRFLQAMLGLSRDEVQEWDKENEKQLEEEFQRISHGKVEVFDCKLMDKRTVERVCKKYNPSIIIIDQIDKIHGFDGDRYDLELKVLYGWARELAAKYGPVIAVCQAGGSGDNKEWLTMNDVDSSKTSKQGEADWILGIGKVFEAGKEMIRYFHLSKNKLVGDPDTDPTERHGKWSCLIQPNIGRYRDFHNDGT